MQRSSAFEGTIESPTKVAREITKTNVNVANLFTLELLHETSCLKWPEILELW